MSDNSKEVKIDTPFDRPENRVKREVEMAITVIEPQRAIQDVKDLYTLMRNMRDSVLTVDIDYGVIPGTGDKPTLLLPGMEKICRALRAVPEYIEMAVTRDYDKPLFSYEFECRLVDAVTGIPLPGGVGKGQCNSYESSFRWRWVEAHRVPTGISKENLETRTSSAVEFAFAVDKAETTGKYGKPESYWAEFREAIQSGKAKNIKRKANSGKEFDAWEISTTLYRIENQDIFDQVNAILKRAKKRALGDAVKGAAAVSEFFTVDLEDMLQFPTLAPVHQDIVDADFVEVVTPPEAQVETAPEPEAPADSKPKGKTLDTKILKEVIAFMYPDDQDEFHRNGTIKNLMANGTLTPHMSGYEAVETIILHRAFKDYELDEPKVFKALTVAANEPEVITTWAAWYKDRKGSITAHQEAWEAIVAYHENANLEPAQAGKKAKDAPEAPAETEQVPF